MERELTGNGHCAMDLYRAERAFLMLNRDSEEPDQSRHIDSNCTRALVDYVHLIAV